MRSTVKTLCAAIIASWLCTSSVAAMSLPTYPSCFEPKGQVKVNYDHGTHGIVGSSDTYTGSDTVYNVAEGAFLQCFCPDKAGDGIQTNWLKVADLSEGDIQVLKNQGWYYVPNGALWGLDEDPYMAYNVPFTCHSTGGGGGGTGGGGSTSGGTGGGDILAASTGDVLGLAATGDNVFLYAAFGFGLLFFLLGYFKKRRKQSN